MAWTSLSVCLSVCLSVSSIRKGADTSSEFINHQASKCANEQSKILFLIGWQSGASLFWAVTVGWLCKPRKMEKHASSRTKQTIVCSFRGLIALPEKIKWLFSRRTDIRRWFSVRLWYRRAQKRSNKEEMRLLKLGVEPECLLLVQRMCSEDSVPVMCMWLGRCHVYTGFGARAHYARELFNCDVIISSAHFQNTMAFFSCISALYSWFPLYPADHCLPGNGILRYN